MSESELPVTPRRKDLSHLVAEIEEMRSRVDRRTATTRLRASLAPKAIDPHSAPTVPAIPRARVASVPPPSPPLPEPAASRYSQVEPVRRP